MKFNLMKTAGVTVEREETFSSDETRKRKILWEKGGVDKSAGCR